MNTKPNTLPHVKDALKKPAKGTVENREEIGGVKGPEPTRYGDWEHGGRCTDF